MGPVTVRFVCMCLCKVKFLDFFLLIYKCAQKSHQKGHIGHLCNICACIDGLGQKPPW